MRLIDKDATVKALREDPVGFNLSAKNNVDGWIEARPEVDAIPLDWINNYINNLKAMGVQLSLRDAQAVSVMVDKWAMEQNGNATCGPDYCDINFGGGTKA